MYINYTAISLGPNFNLDEVIYSSFGEPILQIVQKME